MLFTGLDAAALPLGAEREAPGPLASLCEYLSGFWEKRPAGLPPNRSCVSNLPGPLCGRSPRGGLSDLDSFPPNRALLAGCGDPLSLSRLNGLPRPAEPLVPPPLFRRLFICRVPL